MTRQIGAVIVTHNSEAVLDRCLESLFQQTVPCSSVVIVDCGSADPPYLEHIRKRFPVTVLLQENIGFSRGNNCGVQVLPKGTDIVVFVNPDVFLPPDYLEKLSTLFDANPRCAVVSGSLEKFDLTSGLPTGVYDSTGIFRSWFGRWYDRDQGRALAGIQREKACIPAACGALLACRCTAVMPFFPDIFAPEFFLYKEDIELCIRLRKHGWNILYDPSLHAYHGRGWQQDRALVPYQLRRTAAESELLLYKRHPSPYMIWALVKYLLVRWLKV